MLLTSYLSRVEDTTSKKKREEKEKGEEDEGQNASAWIQETKSRQRRLDPEGEANKQKTQASVDPGCQATEIREERGKMQRE